MVAANIQHDRGPAPSTVDAVALSPADNVATVLRAVAAGETVRVRTGAQVIEVTAVEAIPFCHKISLRGIAEGDPVLKYGAAIGQARVQVAQGCHVHVHNLTSLRAHIAPGHGEQIYQTSAARHQGPALSRKKQP